MFTAKIGSVPHQIRGYLLDQDSQKVVLCLKIPECISFFALGKLGILPITPQNVSSRGKELQLKFGPCSIWLRTGFL